MGSFCLGFFLDRKGLGRGLRARVGFAFVLVLTVGVWGGAFAWQRKYTRAGTSLSSFHQVDLTDSGYAGPLVLFMALGFFDAVWQSYILW